MWGLVSIHDPTKLPAALHRLLPPDVGEVRSAETKAWKVEWIWQAKLGGQEGEQWEIQGLVGRQKGSRGICSSGRGIRAEVVIGTWWPMGFLRFCPVSHCWGWNLLGETWRHTIKIQPCQCAADSHAYAHSTCIWHSVQWALSRAY